MARFIRTQSKAALRAIVVIHASSEPRPGSNITPFLHARSKATCTTSSAEPESPTIPNAIQHSRRQKRSTNFPAHSSSPAQKPFIRSSSDTLSCVITTSPFALLSSRIQTMEHTLRPWCHHPDGEDLTSSVMRLKTQVGAFAQRWRSHQCDELLWGTGPTGTGASAATDVTSQGHQSLWGVGELPSTPLSLLLRGAETQSNDGCRSGVTRSVS
jgi:hypothetical protein